jgi:hypothetical protein
MATVKLMHRTLGDMSKPPANIPTGVWKLRAIKISAKDVTKTNRDGEEYETKEYTMTMEPIAPTASVNPEEVNEVDPRSGRPAYDGKRLFLRYTDAFASDVNQLVAAFGAMGFGKDADFDEIIDDNQVRGKTVFGEIFNRTYRKNDGSDGVEQKVRSWASTASADGFAI